MRQSIKATIATLAFTAGLAGLVTLATHAGHTKAEREASSNVITLPEQVITGHAPIVLPEVVIVASPSKVARKGHRSATTGRMVRDHELRQGGRPGATRVVMWEAR